MSVHSAPGTMEKGSIHENSQEQENTDSRSEIVSTRTVRNLTSKGKYYQINLKDSARKSAYLKLKKQINSIETLNDSNDVNVLCAVRDKLDSLKDEWNQAQFAYDELLESDRDKQSSYQWYDIRDREFTECRIKLSEKIQSLERQSSHASNSVYSGSGKSSVSSKSRSNSSSKTRSSRSVRLEAAAKSARLKTKLKFIEKENELRHFQLMKDIAIAEAEERAIKEVIDKETADLRVDTKELISEVKKESGEPQLSPHPVPFVPKTEPHVLVPISSKVTDETLKVLISLQEKQTELNSQIIKQQRNNSLPIKEPPVFSGNPFEFPSFITAFDTIISENVPSEKDRLYFLEKYTSGKANDVVKGFLSVKSETSYKEARKLLEHRFGNPIYVVEEFKSRLFDWPQINDSDSVGLRDFSDFLIRCIEAAKSIGAVGDLDSTQTLRQVSAKLPSYSGVKWCRHAHASQVKTKKRVSFQEFVEFVKGEAELANDPVFSPDALKRERQKLNSNIRDKFKKGKDNKASNALATSAISSPVKEPRPDKAEQQVRKCPLCDKDHLLAKCYKFTEKSLEERSDFIRSNSLCFKCFKKGHVSLKCKSTVSCNECGKPHHSLLHGAKPKLKKASVSQTFSESKTANKSEPEVNSASLTAASVTHSAVGEHCIVTNSMIVPIFLYHKDNPRKEVKVFALLDDASDTTFVTTKVQQDLGLKGVETSLSLSTMLGREDILVSKIEGLVAQPYDRGAEVDLPRAYARENIPSRRDQIPTPDVAEKWPHLQRIKSKIPLYEDLEIGVLIGCNCPKAIKPREVILGGDSDPYAIKTVLGWGIIGPVGEPNSLTDKNEFSTCNRIISQEVIPDVHSNLTFVLNTPTREVIQPALIKKMFELDFSEHKSLETISLSKEDRRFLAIAEEGVHQREDGHYELPLPLKEDSLNLPDNRDLAFRRLSHLKRKFESTSGGKFREDYVDFMNKMIENGFAEKVAFTNMSRENQPEVKKNVWYIPHHGVYHPRKPDKIRVVFDCAAQFKNESLNKHLLQGPNLTNNLTGILCRFRQEQVAFTCDIEAMFHQVKVNQEHRDLLRFLWWENGDTSREPQEYRMTVHLFGATSSPGCANFALKCTANDNEKEFGTPAADLIRKDFYVDDGLKSVQSTKEAIQLIGDVKKMCSKGGFNLHKFNSNSKDVLKSLPESVRAEGVKQLNLDLDSLPIERTLGVQWCIESDCFQFCIVPQNKPCTRRGILSTVSSIFDPIGFVAPLLLEGKSILQELCRQDLDWDEPIPDEIKTRWEKWKTELIQLESISISRCYKPKDFGNIQRAELHHFSDASVKGYGQCSYMRLVNEDNKIHCALIMGKSRVTPLKPITIPRLELTAAVSSVKISQQLQRDLEYKFDQEYFWTDSKVVLGYINNESRRFHVFVANRVQEIQEHTTTNQWRYIDTKNNPADYASRGMKAQDFSHSQWFSGPDFLWNDESEWPSDSHTLICNPSLNDNDPEVKKSLVVMTTTGVETPQKVTEMPSLESRVAYFSDWYRAKRAVAICSNYVKLLQDRVQNRKSSFKGSQSLSTNHFQNAEKLIIRSVQANSFGKEIAALKNVHKKDMNSSIRCLSMESKAAIKSHSTLYKLNPFIDEEGILRVGGRLRRASVPNDMKFPVILPKKSHVTNLVVKHFHDRVKHQGKGITLNEIRSSGFWIIGGSSCVANIISSCVNCQKLRGATQEQQMADLPEDRLECTPPFTNCGVDYFGPFLIKERRKELKRWGVLFTCMASRAVHLESSVSLDTDSFINALRRFICRRGPVRLIRSDQGTNFVGARTELAKALAELDQSKITSTLREQFDCDWSFKMNVPAASHMGGVWERQIRTVRSVLSALLLNNGLQLDDESLRTLMCEAEAIVNCRPLTYDQLSDPDSPSPLTPNHLLTMKSKLILSPPSVFQSADIYCRRRWRRVQHLANEFWTRWRKEFLLSLQERQKWIRPRRNLCVGDVVIIKDDSPRSVWQLSRVSALYPSADGIVRKVQVALADNCLDNKGKRKRSLRYLDRPVHKLVLLVPAPVE